MAQKSNPISLRLEKTNKHWNSCWYGDYNYTTQLLQDCALEAHMENICQQAKMAPPVVFTNRGRQRIETFFFFPRQQSLRKIRAKREKRFLVMEQKKNSIFQLFLSYKKAIKHEKNPTTSLGHGQMLSRGGVESKKFFQYFLLSLFSPKWSSNTLVDLENLSSVEQHSSCERPAGYASKLTLENERGVRKNSAAVDEKGTFGDKRAAAILLPSQEFLQSWSDKKKKVLSLPSKLADRTSLKNFPGGFPYKVPPTPIKNHLEHSISRQTYYKCALNYIVCPSAHQNPLFLATQVVFSLEERIPFRRLKHRIIRDISKDNAIKGVRITCSGRVAARSKKAQKAKTESIQWGQTSLHVFSDFVHFASKSARTGFGKIGVKVWICYR